MFVDCGRMSLEIVRLIDSVRSADGHEAVSIGMNEYLTQLHKPTKHQKHNQDMLQKNTVSTKHIRLTLLRQIEPPIYLTQCLPLPHSHSATSPLPRLITHSIGSAIRKESSRVKSSQVNSRLANPNDIQIHAACNRCSSSITCSHLPVSCILPVRYPAGFRGSIKYNPIHCCGTWLCRTLSRFKPCGSVQSGDCVMSGEVHRHRSFLARRFGEDGFLFHLVIGILD